MKKEGAALAARILTELSEKELSAFANFLQSDS